MNIYYAQNVIILIKNKIIKKMILNAINAIIIFVPNVYKIIIKELVKIILIKLLKNLQINKKLNIVHNANLFVGKSKVVITLLVLFVNISGVGYVENNILANIMNYTI